MENRRFMLIALLAVILFFLYQAWQDDYGAKPATATTGLDVVVPESVEALAPINDDSAPAIPAASPGNAASELDGAPAAVVGSSGQSYEKDRYITVKTDVVRARLSLRGGDIRSLELLKYPLSKEQPDTPLPLLLESDSAYFIYQSGLAGTQRAIASGNTIYSSAADHYELGEGEEYLDVVLENLGEDGVAVRKTYRFARGAYQITQSQEVDNQGSQVLTVSPYARFVRNEGVVGSVPKFVYTFLGVGIYKKKDDGKAFHFDKTSLDDLGDDPIEQRQTGGWISLLQHYFLAAFIPSESREGIFSAKPRKDGKYAVQHVATGASVAPGQREVFTDTLFLGPRLQDTVRTVSEEGAAIVDGDLDDVAKGLELTVDYGILTVLCGPLFWLLSKFHNLTGNWGFSIILLTLVVKAAFYKLSEAQYRSMGKMKKFAPRIQELKERYGDDRERMSKAMMDLYKKEGFNPLAGCWPLLLQFPVFIALYWVLLESVELRQAEFMLWLNDLSAPDPYYVLPVLFGISFYVQQKWSGSTATMDPMQQKIMNVMPIMMTGFFAFFQSGLVLYWLVSNLIGMAQQWFINKTLEREGLGRTKPAQS